jgi:type II secretory pathway pseudopilin PulG
MKNDCTGRGVEMEQKGEQGFMLVGLIVAIFLILLALSVAAPKVAEGLRREREEEAVHRGNEYVRAVRLYYRKNKTYPGSMDQLEKSNAIRFLRQKYVDPMTGKSDWRVIHVGEAKTTVKGFFGTPLAGLAPGLGSASGMNSGFGGAPGAPGTGGTGFGASSTGTGYGASSPGGSGLGSSSPSGGLGASSTPTLGGGSATGGSTAAGPGSTTPGTDSSGTGTPGTSTGFGSQSAFAGSGGPFVGVGVPKEGDSITILNEQTTYNTWEFIYDPRIEAMYAKASLFGGGPATASGLGSAAGNSSGFGNTQGTGFGNTQGTGFGNTSGAPGTGSGTPTLGAPSTPPPSPVPQQ